LAANKHNLARFILAGPAVFITAIAVMAGATVWFPQGAAEVDNIVIPLVLFPAIWAVLFFYACLDRYLKRAYAVIIMLLLVQIGLIAGQLFG